MHSATCSRVAAGLNRSASKWKIFSRFPTVPELRMVGIYMPGDGMKVKTLRMISVILSSIRRTRLTLLIDFFLGRDGLKKLR
jgi:hypothetical protein